MRSRKQALLTVLRRLNWIALTLVVLIAVGCGRISEPSQGRMVVAASIAPLYDFSRQVGGSLVEVKLLVPPGASPHTYQLEPAQMKILSHASVLVLNGVGLEYWADKALDAADNPKLIVVRTAEGLPIVSKWKDPHHPGGNPHVWLNPQMAIRQVEAIRDAFVKADPAHDKLYAKNAERFIQKLRLLDEDIRRRVKTFRSRSFIAFHPAWIYFAKEYGLDQAAAIEESPGKEPSPEHLRRIIEMARQLRVKAVFAEPQFSPKAAQVIADEIGAKVIILDPIGQPPDYSYIETMRRNIERMAQGLGQ